MRKTTLSTLAIVSMLGMGMASTTYAEGSGQDSTSSSTTMRLAQVLLSSMNLYNGEPDGLVGPKTRDAIKSFQQRESLPQSGDLDQRTLGALNKKASSLLGGGTSGGVQENANTGNNQGGGGRNANTGNAGGGNNANAGGGGMPAGGGGDNASAGGGGMNGGGGGGGANGNGGGGGANISAVPASSVGGGDAGGGAQGGQGGGQGGNISVPPGATSGNNSASVPPGVTSGNNSAPPKAP